MATIKDDVTLFRWEIKDFELTKINAQKTVLYSDAFPLAKHPSIQLCLFVDTKFKLYNTNGVGLVLKQNRNNLNKIEIYADLWLENKDGQKFGKYSHFKDYSGGYTPIYPRSISYNDKFICCGGKLHGDAKDPYYSSICSNGEMLVVCCKVTDRNPDPEPIDPVIPTVDFEHKVLQAQWSLYEQGKYDAILKVGDKELKVLKLFLTCHSDVFEQAFSSNFKESQTNVIEIKDFDERTVKNLVKWLYTGQIEDNDVIDQLFEAADKYNVNLLKKFCFQHMIASLNKDNAFSRLVLASMHNDDQLKEACLNQISLMDKSDWATFAISQEWIGFVRKNVNVSDEITELVRDKLKI